MNINIRVKGTVWYETKHLWFLKKIKPFQVDLFLVQSKFLPSEISVLPIAPHVMLIIDQPTEENRINIRIYNVETSRIYHEDMLRVMTPDWNKLVSNCQYRNEHLDFKYNIKVEIQKA